MMRVSTEAANGLAEKADEQELEYDDPVGDWLRGLAAHRDELSAALQNIMNGIETGAITSNQDETFANAIQRAKKALS